MYGADGEYKFKWGGPFAYNSLITYFHWFPFDGWFADPKALAVDSASRIYVGDSSNKRIQVFEGDGSFVTAFGAERENEFGSISGIDVAGDGSIFVVDESKRTIQKWQHAPGA